MFRFLPGIIVVQIATVALVLATMESGNKGYWISLGVIALITSLLAAFWFNAIAGQMHKDAVAQAKEAFAEEREKIRVKAEKDKLRLVERSHKRVAKETNRAHAKANLKVGAAFAAAVGMGGLMVLAEFLTLGLLTMSTAGGALVGYVARGRYGFLSRKNDELRTRAPRARQLKAVVGKSGSRMPSHIDKPSV